MKLFANIKNFAADESGAVTVDWVVLTAAIVGLGIAVIASVQGGVNTLANSISEAVGETAIGTTPEEADTPGS
ncbi:Flp family type IVb pilin [Roseinatronobacter sp.]